jgi:hypothetical protein
MKKKRFQVDRLAVSEGERWIIENFTGYISLDGLDGRKDKKGYVLMRVE